VTGPVHFDVGQRECHRKHQPRPLRRGKWEVRVLIDGVSRDGRIPTLTATGVHLRCPAYRPSRPNLGLYLLLNAIASGLTGCVLTPEQDHGWLWTQTKRTFIQFSSCSTWGKPASHLLQIQARAKQALQNGHPNGGRSRSPTRCTGLGSMTVESVPPS